MDVSRLNTVRPATGPRRWGRAPSMVDTCARWLRRAWPSPAASAPTWPRADTSRAAGSAWLTRHVRHRSDDCAAAARWCCRRPDRRGAPSSSIPTFLGDARRRRRQLRRGHRLHPRPDPVHAAPRMVMYRLAWRGRHAGTATRAGWSERPDHRWRRPGPAARRGRGHDPPATRGAIPGPSAGTVEELNRRARPADLELTGPGRLPAGGRAKPYQAFMMASYGCADLHRPAVPPRRVERGRGAAADSARLQRSRLFGGPVSRSVWERAMAVFDTHRVAAMHNLRGPGARRSGQRPGPHRDRVRPPRQPVHRRFLVQGTRPQSDEDIAAGRQWVAAGFDALDPDSNGETYQNFIDPALPDWRRSYYQELPAAGPDQAQVRPLRALHLRAGHPLIRRRGLGPLRERRVTTWWRP